MCLSHMLSHHGRYAVALEHYRAQRFPRTARVQLLSRAIGGTSITRRATTPASATPSWARRARRTITAIWPGCMAGRDWRDKPIVPAKQGASRTHNHRPSRLARWSLASRNNGHWWLWVPAFARTTSNMSQRSRYILVNYIFIRCACRSILPVPVFGNSSVKVISRGYLYGSNFALT